MTTQDHQSPLSFSSHSSPSFKILNNTTEITTTVLSFFVNATERLDGFGLTNGFPMILEDNLLGIITSLRNQGKRMRYITEINKDNLLYCEMMSRVLELRHLNKINGAMMINDNEYLSIIESKKKNNNGFTQPVYLHSNNKLLVSQQHQIFDILWEKSIPSNKRIEQIKSGQKSQKEEIEIIYDKHKTLDLYKNTINAAQNEIIVFYYASNDFSVQTLQKLIDMIRELIKDVKVKVKIIVSLKHASILKSLKLDFDNLGKGQNFQIKHIDGFFDYSLSSSKNLIMLLADKKKVLITETNYDKENKGFDDAIEYTIYSTSPSVIYSYRIILENLWKQNDLYKMLEIANMKLEVHEIMEQHLIHNFANGLRNPVQPLLGLSEILLSKEDADLNKYKDILKVIHHSAQKLTLRINNVLNATEIENNTHTIRKESFNLLDLLDRLASYHCNNNFCKHKVTYQISYDGDQTHNNPPLLYADKNKIKLLIDNILINAIDNAKAKELYISIIKHQRGNNHLCDDDKNGNLEIRIVDDGKGIDNSIVEEMFSKYKTNSDDGLGLGLYVAKNIVGAHGGQIWAQNNKDGKGATISFCIPAADK